MWHWSNYPEVAIAVSFYSSALTTNGRMIGRKKSEYFCHAATIDFLVRRIIYVVRDEGVAERNTKEMRGQV